MRYLYYTNYRSGKSGLSNGIMSIELGVVLAFLTNRLLVLDGNITPPANVVAYDDRVDTSNPSRVTDLFDLPVAWTEPDEVQLDDLDSLELTDQHLMDAVYYAPETLDITSSNAQSFARSRKTWLNAASGELADIPVLRVSEAAPEANKAEIGRSNLSFYSYFFYLDDETRRSVYRLLQRMQAKKPYRDLVQKVVKDLGSFNAVHLRRGDFKVTYGVTTLARQPWEAIEVLESHFDREHKLVIVTDERDDPFFDEIKLAYPQHIFIDHHILANYEEDFRNLPQNDSLALAHLSQLVAAESMDFIGTMTSTFTALIQRYRGNRGCTNHFKFLWNELPERSDRVERGLHPVSDCVPLMHGVMVEELDGPYSWNRYNQRINPAWMREWPESFLTEEVLFSGRLPPLDQTHEAPSVGAVTAANLAGPSRVLVDHEDLRVAIRTDVSGLAFRLAEVFGPKAGADSSGVIAELEISGLERGYRLVLNGRFVEDVEHYAAVPAAVKRHLAPVWIRSRPSCAWLRGTALSRAGGAIVIAGDVGGGEPNLIDALCSSGWELLWDDVIPVRVQDSMILPFGRSSWPKGASVRIDWANAPLSAVIVSSHLPHSRESINKLSMAVAVAELIPQSMDVSIDQDRGIRRLCELAEQRPVFHLTFSRAERAANLLCRLAEDGGLDTKQQKAQAQ